MLCATPCLFHKRETPRVDFERTPTLIRVPKAPKELRIVSAWYDQAITHTAQTDLWGREERQHRWL